MKNIFKYLCMVATALATTITLSSFSTIDEDEFDFEEILKVAIAEIDAECPQDMGDGMTLERVTISNNRIIYLISSPQDIVEGFNLMKELNSAATSKMMLESMLEGGDEVVFLFLICAGANYGIEFIFKSSDGQSANLVLSSKELSDTLSNKYSVEYLENIVDKLIFN